jgi:hypothetical protein
LHARPCEIPARSGNDDEREDREHDPASTTPAADRRERAVDAQLGEVRRFRRHGAINEAPA